MSFSTNAYMYPSGVMAQTDMEYEAESVGIDLGSDFGSRVPAGSLRGRVLDVEEVSSLWEKLEQYRDGDGEEEESGSVSVNGNGKTIAVQNVISKKSRRRSYPAHRSQREEYDWECGICLETASDPCVSTCGHLFCWSDLRQWLERNISDPRCPVCKSPCVPDRDVVPIFGRGRSLDFGRRGVGFGDGEGSSMDEANKDKMSRPRPRRRTLTLSSIASSSMSFSGSEEEEDAVLSRRPVGLGLEEGREISYVAFDVEDVPALVRRRGTGNGNGNGGSGLGMGMGVENEVPLPRIRMPVPIHPDTATNEGDTIPHLLEQQVNTQNPDPNSNTAIRPHSHPLERLALSKLVINNKQVAHLLGHAFTVAGFAIFLCILPSAVGR